MNTSTAREFWMDVAHARFLSKLDGTLTWQNLRDEANALKDILALAEHNCAILYPVSRIPREILLAIFAATRDVYLPKKVFPLDNIPWDIKPVYDIGWIKITHVCREWRALALSDASLWVHIEPTALSIRWAATMLQRSHRRPLSLKLCVTEAATISRYLGTKPHFPIHSLEIVREGPYYMFPDHLPPTLPNLPMSLKLPNLTSLTLVDTKLDVWSSIFAQITHMWIVNTPAARFLLHPWMIASLLEKAPNTSEVVFENIRIDHYVPDPLHVPLSLERCVISSNTTGRASRSVNLASKIVLPPPAKLIVDLFTTIPDRIVCERMPHCISTHAGRTRPPFSLSLRLALPSIDTSTLDLSIGTRASPWSSSFTIGAPTEIPPDDRSFRWSTDLSVLDPSFYGAHLEEIVDLRLDVEPGQPHAVWETLFRRANGVRRICAAEHTAFDFLPVLARQFARGAGFLPWLNALCITKTSYVRPAVEDDQYDEESEDDPVGAYGHLVHCLQTRRRGGFGLREVRIPEGYAGERWAQELREAVPFVGYSRTGYY